MKGSMFEYDIGPLVFSGILNNNHTLIQYLTHILLPSFLDFYTGFVGPVSFDPQVDRLWLPPIDWICVTNFANPKQPPWRYLFKTNTQNSFTAKHLEAGEQKRTELKIVSNTCPPNIIIQFQRNYYTGTIEISWVMVSACQKTCLEKSLERMVFHDEHLRKIGRPSLTVAGRKRLEPSTVCDLCGCRRRASGGCDRFHPRTDARGRPLIRQMKWFNGMVQLNPSEMVKNNDSLVIAFNLIYMGCVLRPFLTLRTPLATLVIQNHHCHNDVCSCFIFFQFVHFIFTFQNSMLIFNAPTLLLHPLHCSGHGPHQSGVAAMIGVATNVSRAGRLMTTPTYPHNL